MNTTPRLLVIGGLPNEELKCQYGGATVLMKNLVEYLHHHDIQFRFIQTNKYISAKTFEPRKGINFAYMMLKYLLLLPWCSVVMYNFSDHALVHLFPYLSFWARLLKKKTVLRKFGGSFDIYLSHQSPEKVSRVRNALCKTNLVFFETKAGISHLHQLLGETKTKIQWFPNVRKAVANAKPSNAFSRRLVFMSHISDEKGIGDLLQAFKLLPPTYELDIYGAIKETKYIDFNWDEYGVRYLGEIASEEVLQKLPTYSLLILPSYREGYPGIIIEAMSVGVPVVSTLVGGIPEVVIDGKTGRLVSPGDFKQLAEAILYFSEKNYSEYCENAYQRFCSTFESDATNNRIISQITSL